MSDYRSTTKKIARFIVGLSVSSTVSKALAYNVPPQDKAYKRAQVVVGSVVVGAIAADYGKRWTDDFVDTIFDAFSPKEDKEDPIVVSL